MNREAGFSRLARLAPLVAVFAVVALVGCAAGRSLHKVEKVEEGPMAAQRAAQADLAAQSASGAQGLQGTTSSIPSLVPGEGQVQLPAAAAAPATAPPPDQFDDKNPGHLLARCRDREARHEWFDAVGDCRRSYELNPASIEPQVELMRLLVDLQSYGDAEDAASKVLAAKPNDAVALYYLAWSYRGREQFPKAIAALQRAIAADPKRLEFVQALGMTYCLADDYGRGLATLDRALAMHPGDAKTTNAIASARAVLVERLEPYRRLVKEKPDSYDNHAALGFMLQKYGLSEKALTEYDTALQLIPTPLARQELDTRKLAAQIYYNRGVVYRDLGKPEVAEPALSQAMQLDPSLAAFSWYYIGLCRYDAGKFDTSIDALRKSVDLSPDVADNRSALADAYDKADQAGPAAEQRNAVAAIQARVAAEKAAATEAARTAPAAGAATTKPSAVPPAAGATAKPTPAPATNNPAAKPETSTPASDAAATPAAEPSEPQE